MEEVEADPGITDKRLLLYEPEFANMLKQTERLGNTASVVIRQAWDGREVLRTLTKNSLAQATGAHISFVAHITGEELQRYLSQTETANGFANRFMFFCTERSKLLPDGGHLDQAQLDALCVELVEALDFARSAGEIKRDGAARVIWHDVYGPLSEGKPGLAGRAAGASRSSCHATGDAVASCWTSPQRSRRSIACWTGGLGLLRSIGAVHLRRFPGG